MRRRLNRKNWNGFSYEADEPLEIFPEIFGVPSRGWIEKAYDGKKTKRLRDILDLPIVKDNDKIKEIKNNFPSKTILTAILFGDEIILIEGMHRSCVLVLWDKQQKIKSKIFIALSEWPGKEIPVIGSGYKNSSREYVN